MMNMTKGSYTVEAALVVPLLIFVFVVAMNLAINLYQEVLNGQPEYYEEDVWTVKTFYKWEIAGGVVNGED